MTSRSPGYYIKRDCDRLCIRKGYEAARMPNFPRTGESIRGALAGRSSFGFAPGDGVAGQ